MSHSRPTDPTADHPSAPEAAATVTPTLREGPGTKIGPYRILQLIGEGGFGSVFMTEQEQPVQRRVALKIIKLGMDTRQVVARFEQERQAWRSWIIRASPRCWTPARPRPGGGPAVVSRDRHVARLDVPMDEPLGVRVLDRLAHLHKELQPLGDAQ
jgi:hypothetical protein